MRFLACRTLLLTIFLSAFVYANVIHVPADQPTIQAGINAAVNGDTVQVAPGTYYENINFSGKAITLAGAQTVTGSSPTIIDGGRQGTVVTFSSGEGPQSILTGFTIQNGRASFDGGGIRISQSSPTIANNNITNNTANTDGGGISVSFGSPLIRDNLIGYNFQTIGFSGGNGQGIYIGGASSAQVIHNLVVSNNAQEGSGGGIALFAAGAALVQGNHISNNRARNQGGGIWIVNDSSALIVNNVIDGNDAPTGGGIYWLVPSGSRGPYAVNNTIAGNTSAGGAGISQSSAIFASGFQAQAKIINNVLISSAGLIPLYCDGTYSSSPPTVLNNDAYSAGGVAYSGTCAGMNGSSGNISADPLFSSTSSLYSGFGLASGSPAIDSGTSFQAPSIDLNNRPRPQDGNGDAVAAFDMGAYEMDAVPVSISVGISSSVNPATTVQVVTFTATVTPAAEPGTMQFFDGSTNLGTVPVNNGIAAFSGTLAAGTHSITAFFTSSNPGTLGCGSPALTETVVKTPAVASMTASGQQSNFGQAVTLAANVSPNTATGTVQFLDGTTPLGTVALHSGTAQLIISTLAVGNHSLSVVYSGDATFLSSTSSALTLSVVKATPAISVTAAPNPVVFGQADVITVSLAPNAATGVVQFFDGSVSLGTVTVASGTASLTTSALSVGTHSITAAYNGNSSYNAVTSTAVSLVVNRVPTSTAITSSANPSVRNKAVTFTSLVTPSSATGSVQFFDGGTLLGTIALRAGTASLATSDLAVGTHSITAVYSGSQNFASSTSPVLSQVVNKH